MRTRILIPCLLALAWCGLVVLWKEVPPNKPAAATGISPAAQARAAEKAVSRDEAGLSSPGAEIFAAAIPEEPAGNAARLASLARREDSDGLGEIISALADADPEIRTAACAAAEQSGDRRLIPALQDAASRADDGREKMALLTAADFLQLPSLSETLAER